MMSTETRAKFEKYKAAAIKMEEWYKDRTLPDPPIKLNAATTIVDVKKFVETQLMVIKANQEKPWQAAFKPAYMRLFYLKQFIENAQAGTTDGKA